MRLVFRLTGVALIVAAAALSSAAIERLTGHPSGALRWGPPLFRALLVLHGALLIALPRMALSRPRLDLPWKPLIALSAVALALRLIRLDSCLWLDEVFALVDTIRRPLPVILTTFQSQNQHMLYSVLAHLCAQVFGESFWSIRLPAVLFGVASLWPLYLLGRRLIGAQGALLACILATVSYHHVWFSQNARGYTGLLAFTLLATWLFLQALDHDGWGWWLAYALAGFLGAWIHLTMAFVLAGHIVVWLSKIGDSHHFSPGTTVLSPTMAGSERWLTVPNFAKSRWKPIAAWGLCGTLTLQAYALSLPQFLATAAGEVSLRSEWIDPMWVVRESTRNLQVAFAGLAVVLLGAVIACAGWLEIFRRQRRAALAMLLPPLLGGATMLALQHNLWPRFFFFAMGFALLVAVHGAMVLTRKLPLHADTARRAGMVLVAVVIAASALTLPRCYALPKQDFTGARDYLERVRRPGETIAAVGLAGKIYPFFAPSWETPAGDPEFAALESARPITWLVYTLPIQLRAWHPGIRAAVDRDFEVVRAFPGTLGDGTVYVCRKRTSGSGKMGADR